MLTFIFAFKKAGVLEFFLISFFSQKEMSTNINGGQINNKRPKASHNLLYLCLLMLWTIAIKPIIYNNNVVMISTINVISVVIFIIFVLKYC